MTVVSCPLCDYETDDDSDTIAVVLLSTHAISHTPGATASSAKVERVKRPVVSSAGTSEDWNYFLSRWNYYVEATKVTGKDEVLQLLECCDEEIRRDVNRMSGGSLTNKTAEEALLAIRTLAVWEESPMVARAALYAMHQDRYEPVRTFAARARGQARTCKFTQDCPQCSTAVIFTDTMIRDVVTRGLEDREIQQDLLGDRNQEPCLEEVIQFVESKESGKRSAIRLLDSPAVGAISRYNRSKKDEIKASNSTQFARRAAAINRPNSDPHEPCHYCGKRCHGKRALPQVRAAECPAYGHECNHCHKRDHFESVCRGRSARREDSKDNTQAAFQSLSSVTEHFSPLYSVTILDQNPGRGAIALDDHVYDQLSKMWLRRSYEPQPYTMLTVTPIGEDYAHLGFPLKSRTRSSIV